MKVKDLIEELSMFDEDTEVFMTHDYGDYSHHIVAQEIKGIELRVVEYSDYVREFCVPENDVQVRYDEDANIVEVSYSELADEDSEKYKEVVVLSYTW